MVSSELKMSLPFQKEQEAGGIKGNAWWNEVTEYTGMLWFKYWNNYSNILNFANLFVWYK